MTAILRVAFAGLGIAALVIGAMIFGIGPEATAQAFAGLLRLFAPHTPPLAWTGGADVDSEMRFYAAIWMGYGALALKVARDLPARMTMLRLMLGFFWLGGLGRLLSYVTVGAPHPLFTVLMAIELALPLALLALSARVR